MKKLPLLTLAGSLCFGSMTLLSLAQAESIPVAAGGAAGEITGTVMVVNTETRLMTIRKPDGEFKVIQVPPEVQRLDEIKINDKLTVSYLEAVAVDLKKGAAAGPSGAVATKEIDRVPGKKPEGTITETVTATGTVEAVSKASSSVTIRGPEKTVTVTVEDPEMLNEVGVGDSVTVTYIRAVAAKVEAAVQGKSQAPRQGKF